MRRLNASIATLALLALALCIEISHAQGPNDKRNKPITDAGVAKKVASIDKQPANLDKAKKVTVGPRIGSFEAKRNQRDISLDGSIENLSLQSMTAVTYSMFKMTPSGWQLVKSGGNVTINARKTIFVNSVDAFTNASVRYKLEVVGNGLKDTREFVLAERKISYVVKFDTRGAWLLARHWSKGEPTAVVGKSAPANGRDALPGGIPQRLVDQLRGLGLEAKMSYKRYDYAFDDTEFEFWVYCRTSGPVEKTFNDRNAANAFRDQMRSLVADKGLSIEVLER